MPDLHYNGSVVESVISELNSIKGEFSSLSSDIKTATVKIVSSQGYNEYIGGITSDTFCGYVSECENAVSLLTKFIREKQINILAFNQDKKEINAFLDGLSNSEYNSLDLSSLEDYISLGRKAGNFFKGIGASIATFGLGLIEGVADFVETGCDLVTLGGSLFQSVFTLGYDCIMGTDTTKQLWDETRAKVSEKPVESAFNSFYENTSIGKSLKENAYGFESVRGVGKGLGYTAGVIGVTVLTGGIAGGAIGAAGSVGAGQLALTAGLMGFSNGTEEAWADGATTGKGLLYGAATGAWEGAQWYLGAKINQFGGLGDQVASGLFKGANAGVGTRILMDTADSAAEGFVRPALSMIYKDYGQGNFIDNYKTAFDSTGGWKNVFTQAAIGAVGSAFGEFTGARKLLKENERAAKEGAAAAGEAAAGGAVGGAALLDSDEGSSKIFNPVDSGDNTKLNTSEFDGSYTKNADIKNSSLTDEGADLFDDDFDTSLVEATPNITDVNDPKLLGGLDSADPSIKAGMGGDPSIKSAGTDWDSWFDNEENLDWMYDPSPPPKTQVDLDQKASGLFSSDVDSTIKAGMDGDPSIKSTGTDWDSWFDNEEKLDWMYDPSPPPKTQVDLDQKASGLFSSDVDSTIKTGEVVDLSSGGTPDLSSGPTKVPSTDSRIKGTDIEIETPFARQLEGYPPGYQRYGASNLPQDAVVDSMSTIRQAGNGSVQAGLQEIEFLYGADSIEAVTARGTVLQDYLKDNPFAGSAGNNSDIADHVASVYGVIGREGRDATFAAAEKMKLGISSMDDAGEAACQEIFAADMSKWGASSTEQLAPMKTYTGSSYYDMNKVMRSGNESYKSGVMDSIQQLSSQLETDFSGMSSRTILYRGVDSLSWFGDGSLSGMSGQQLVDAVNGLGGGVFSVTDNAFGSTTPVMGCGFTNKQVVIVTSAPKGTKGAYVGKYSSCNWEVEYLLQAGSGNRQIIHGAELIGGQVFIYTEII